MAVSTVKFPQVCESNTRKLLSVSELYIIHLHTNNSSQNEYKLTFKRIILILCYQVDIFRILVAGSTKLKKLRKYHALKTFLHNQLVLNTSDSSSNNTSDPWNYLFASCLFVSLKFDYKGYHLTDRDI